MTDRNFPIRVAAALAVGFALVPGVWPGAAVADYGDTPKGVKASKGVHPDRIRVSWTKPHNPPFRYRVYMKSAYSADKAWKWSANVPGNQAYHDLKYAKPTLMRIRVTAEFGGKESAPSPVVIGFNGTLPRPKVPTKVSASDAAFADKVRVGWWYADGAAEYRIYRAPASGGTKTRVGTVSAIASQRRHFDDKKAWPGKPYIYWIKACNYQGLCSDWSKYDEGRRSGSYALPKRPPAGVRASDGAYGDKIRVVWNKVAEDTSHGAIRYTVTRTGAGKPASFITSHKVLFDKTAAPGVRYAYAVAACNTYGCSAYSAPDKGFRAVSRGHTARLVPGRPLKSPAKVSASDGGYIGKVRISWSAVRGASSYRVYRAFARGSKKLRIAVTEATWFDDRTALAGRRYRYWVRACRAGACSLLGASDFGHRTTARLKSGAKVRIKPAR